MLFMYDFFVAYDRTMKNLYANQINKLSYYIEENSSYDESCKKYVVHGELIGDTFCFCSLKSCIQYFGSTS